jgi:hypothetical protein
MEQNEEKQNIYCIGPTLPIVSHNTELLLNAASCGQLQSVGQPLELLMI